MVHVPGHIPAPATAAPGIGATSGGLPPEPLYGDPENFPSGYSGGSLRAYDREVVERAPRYGPETGATARNLLRDLGPEDIARVQEAMKAVGLMPDGKFALGLADPRTTAGFQRLLGYANEVGQDWQTALNEFEASAAAAQAAELAAEQEKVRQGRVSRIRQSAPQTVDQAADEAFKVALGRKPTAAQRARFRTAYLGYERRAQQQEFAQLAAAEDAALAGRDSTITTTDPVSLSAYAEDYAQAENPAEAGAMDVSRTFDEFLTMLNPGGF